MNLADIFSTSSVFVGPSQSQAILRLHIVQNHDVVYLIITW